MKRYDVEMMRNQSYIWNIEKDIRGQVDMTDVRTIAEFPCYHTYGWYGFFKPSIAEVLQQFPDDVLEEANAFYMTSTPKNEYDLGLQSEILNAGCHRSTVKTLVLKNNFAWLLCLAKIMLIYGFKRDFPFSHRYWLCQ